MTELGCWAANRSLSGGNRQAKLRLQNPVHEYERALPSALRQSGPPIQRPPLDYDRSGRKLQRDAQRQRRVVVAAPAADKADNRRAERADGPAYRARQPHDDGKTRRTELAIDDQRR